MSSITLRSPTTLRNAAAASIKNDLLAGEDYCFASGCALVVPGTSWGYLNYFLAIRDAKKRCAGKVCPPLSMIAFR